ncbi:MAG: ribosome silencing factor [Holosporales bacterium]|jgi:ribosome-associated protein|nr:ribosome silencing factor [Holosporales bacterium]
MKDGIIDLLNEKKAFDIVEFDLSGRSERLSDACIIATGTSARHLRSVADCIYRYMKNNWHSSRIEGRAESGWVIVESNGVEVHLFKPEFREYYALEELYTR